MKTDLKMNPNGSVTLCGRRLCCPVLSEDPNDSQYVFITDDDGNRIRILKSQASLVNQGLELIDEKVKPARKLLHD